MHQLDDIIGEGVGVTREGASQGAGCGLIGPGSATEAEIDTSGIQARQGAELLRDDERGVVGQHDPARADADTARRLCHMADDQGRCRTCNARHVVVLGEPVAAIAEMFGMDLPARGCVPAPWAGVSPWAIGARSSTERAVMIGPSSYWFSLPSHGAPLRKNPYAGFWLVDPAVSLTTIRCQSPLDAGASMSESPRKPPRVGLFVTCLVDLMRPSVGFGRGEIAGRGGLHGACAGADLLRPAGL